jgi:3-deoxy-D-manno-octulosonate cytidylyltransferase
MAATRLPGKPLAEIHGRPMIAHVLDRAREAGIGPVAVACGEAAIAEAVRAAGGTAVLVADDVPSGTDRVHRALATLDPARAHDVVVNLQGDFPTIRPETLRAVLAPLADPAVDIGTLVCPIADAHEMRAESFVKCACAFDGDERVARALYFSRLPVPWGEGPRWHHIGIYAFRRAALERFVALPASALERREKLEQLRALEAGMRIAAARVEHGPFGVDTPADLERARRPQAWNASMSTDRVIAFQGLPGAYSDLACRDAYPGFTTLPCPSFEAAMAAVRDGRAELAMLPCENSLAGRVPDIHRLLPDSGLHVVGEHFERVEHCLLAPRGATLATIRRARSHPVALGQVLRLLEELRLQPVIEADTAGAAALIAERGGVEDAAIASALAAEIYGLEILRRNVEDAAHNTTRFYVMARERRDPPPEAPDIVTTFVFRVRNVPAALYKALGGFATNGVNMTKLESYMLGGHFTATQFLCDVDGHPEQPPLRRALEELAFFSRELRVLGAYRAHPYRLDQATAGD